MRENITWKNTTFTCPYCGALSTFSCIFSTKGTHRGYIFPFSVWSCHHCDRAIFITQKSSQYDHVVTERLEIESIFPSIESTVDERVPDGIAKDFIEAARCFNISAFKASVVISRRTIQKMCLNLGANKGEKLYEQIDQLKQAGKLHPDLADIATEIRFLGNDGAHPVDDGLDEITNEDAKEILDFTAELLDDLYVRPQKVLAMKKKREDKKSEAS